MVFSRRNRGADVVHNGHMPGPREATWMPSWCIRGSYMARGGLLGGR